MPEAKRRSSFDRSQFRSAQKPAAEACRRLIAALKAGEPTAVAQAARDAMQRCGWLWETAARHSESK